MNDTPKHIKDIQLKIWMSKTPEERLFQFITENDAWWEALKEAKIKLKAATQLHSEKKQEITKTDQDFSN